MSRIPEREWLEHLYARDNEIDRLNSEILHLTNAVQEFESQLHEKNQYIHDLEESIALLDDQLQLQMQVETELRQQYEEQIEKLRQSHEMEMHKQEVDYKNKLQQMTDHMALLNEDLLQKEDDIRSLEEVVNNLDSQVLDLKLKLTCSGDLGGSSLGGEDKKTPECSQINIKSIVVLEASHSKDEDEFGSPVHVRINRDLSRSQNHRDRTNPNSSPPVFSLSSKTLGSNDRIKDSPSSAKQLQSISVKKATSSSEKVDQTNELSGCDNNNNNSSKTAWKDQKKHQNLFTEVDLHIDDTANEHSWDVRPPLPPPVAKSKRK